MNCKPQELKELFHMAANEYAPAFARMRKLHAMDKAKLWEGLKAKFPKYQVLPEVNHISYIKKNIVASVYSVGKSASLIPTSGEDREIVQQLNIALEHLWNILGVQEYQQQAGENAALMNLGITQVGWNNNIIKGIAGKEGFSKGEVVLKNINPMKFMRDPFANSLENAKFCVTWDDFHKTAILYNPLYAEAFKEYLKNHSHEPVLDESVVPVRDTASYIPSAGKGYYRIHCYWVREEGKIHEIHLLNNQYELYRKEDIKPARFPFAMLYFNEPGEDVVGVSECAKEFSNSVAFNVMLSILLTGEYKNQRPPRFVSANSGLNVSTFTKHGNDADRTFVVNGDASRAVHYHQFPTASPTAVQAMSLLNAAIKDVSGVDGRYTGRDTGSILTTGGIDSMLNQVTMIDAPVVNRYESYCKALTQLLVYNYLEHSSLNRKYLVKKGKDYTMVEVPFTEIPSDILFEYEMAVSSELPKSKARLAATATELMEKQMQYKGAGIEVDLITPQEWLSMQDLPNKEQMLERMGVQRTQNWVEMVSHAVTQYAELTKQGMPAEDAIAATADIMAGQSEEDTMQQLQSLTAPTEPAIM